MSKLDSCGFNRQTTLLDEYERDWLMLLQNKVVLVTGGGHGIGGDISRVVAAHGAAVVINYHGSKGKADAVAAEIADAGGQAKTFRADVRDAASVVDLVNYTVEAYGRIDAVVNNAIGGRQNGAFDDLSWDEYSNMFDFGCKAVVNTTRAVRPLMQARGGGRIVNIVTELWNMGAGEWGAYLAGKGAMVGLSRSMANELGPDNITVNMVAPGWMADDKVDTTSEGSLGYAKSLPLRRHGSAKEIGNACVFFISDLAGYVTGTYLPVTGGRVTQMGS